MQSVGQPITIVLPVPMGFSPAHATAAASGAVDRLVAASAPMLTATGDVDPCFPERRAPLPKRPSPPPPDIAAGGAYEISVPSPGQSDHLAAWLLKQGVAVPTDALPALRDAARRHMQFIVAKITPARAGLLPPLILAYDSPDLEVPIGFGTLQAGEAGDALLMVLTHTGRAEAAAIPTRPLPSGMELPEYVTGRFAAVMAASFAHQAAIPGTAILEFAGPVKTDLQAAPLFLTRLHLNRAFGASPTQLRLHESNDNSAFAVRYPVKIAWKGLQTMACTQGFAYRHDIAERWQQENAALAALTGWDPADIRNAMVAEWSALREKEPETE